MAYELFILDGKRKYLNAEEQRRFITAAGAPASAHPVPGAGAYGVPDIRSLGADS